MNPFTSNVEDVFRMKKVQIRNEGNTFTGYLQRMDWNQRHVVLRDAKRNGKSVGSAFISHVDDMVLAEEKEEVRELDPRVVDSIEYSCRSFSMEENADYLASVQSHGSVKSFPTVWKKPSGKYVAIDGHKRLWAARNTSVRSQPCRVLTDLNCYEAFTRFAWNHYPLPDHVEEKNGCVRGERYSDRDTVRSILRAENRLGKDILTIFPVKYNVKRINGDLE